jgi:heme A synthase
MTGERPVRDDELAGRQPGWREVLVVAALVVGVVLGAAVATSLLPAELQAVVFHTPVAIAVLLVGTGWLLWRIARRQPPAE